MAVTVVSKEYKYASTGEVKEYFELSGLTPLASESLTMTGVTLTDPSDVTMRVKTAASSGDPVFLQQANRTAATSTLVVKFDTIPGGDLTDAVVVLCVEYKHAARQDGQSLTQNN
jgi:hypothetical protein